LGRSPVSKKCTSWASDQPGGAASDRRRNNGERHPLQGPQANRRSPQQLQHDEVASCIVRCVAVAAHANVLHNVFAARYLIGRGIVRSSRPAASAGAGTLRMMVPPDPVFGVIVILPGR
jgi:hypothetical protein